MVTLAELGNMFWGVTLDGGKHYTQTVEVGFHISMAALEVTKSGAGGIKSGDYVSVMIRHQKAEFVLCTLQHGHLLQQPLDLNFTEGEEITFFLNGKGIVHLTGYLAMDEMDGMDDMDEESGSDLSISDQSGSEDEAPQLKRAAITSLEDDLDSEDDEEDEDFSPEIGKRKMNDSAKKGVKKARMEDFEEADDSDEDDAEFDEEDFDDEDDEDDFIDDEAEESDSDDDDDDAELNSEDEENLARLSGSFLQAKQKATPKQQKTDDKNKGKDTPKSTPNGKDAPKGKDTPKGKDSPKGKDTPKGKDSPKGKDTPKEKDTPKGKDTPKSQNKASKSTTPAETPKQKQVKEMNGAGEKKTETPKDTQKPDSAGGDSTSKKKKKKNKNKESANTSQTGTPGSQKKPDTPKDTPKDSPKQDKKVQRQTLAGGVVAEDVKTGHGPPATPGKTVHVYYTGKLESGKIFDMNTTGTPFKFKLGKNEVIKGWDVGLAGMKVGGKRTLAIPAKMGYGSQRAGSIPPNSNLIFEVELKNVS